MRRAAPLSVMMIDVVGSSRMWARDPQRMTHALTRLFRVVHRLAAETPGAQLVKCIGDAFLLTFSGRPQARVAAALAVARSLCAWQRGPGGLCMRIGVADGPVYTQRWPVQGCALADVFGTCCNTAARAEAKASPVGGFAYAVCHERADSKQALAVVRAVSRQAGARLVRYVDEGGGQGGGGGLQRSARLVPFSAVVRDVSELHGVPPVDMYVFDAAAPPLCT